MTKSKPLINYHICIPLSTIFDTSGVTLLPMALMSTFRIRNAVRIAVGNTKIDDPEIRARATLLRSLGGTPLRPRTITIRHAIDWAAAQHNGKPGTFYGWSDTGRVLCRTKHIAAVIEGTSKMNALFRLQTSNWWDDPRVIHVGISPPTPFADFAK